MPRKIVNDFDQAIKRTAPDSTGIAILNVLTAFSCVVAAPSPFGGSCESISFNSTRSNSFSVS